MDRAELEKMKLDALRQLAAERGVEGARGKSKAELIEALAPETVLGRAKQAVARAAHKMEEKAHELADRLRHAPSMTEVKGAQPPAPIKREPRRGRPERASFDIPS